MDCWSKVRGAVQSMLEVTIVMLIIYVMWDSRTNPSYHPLPSVRTQRPRPLLLFAW